MSIVRPEITVLNSEQIDEIHQRSLQILESVGVRVDSPHAQFLLSKATGETITGGRMHIPPELVAWALEQAPSSVTLYNRRGKLAFQLGRDPAADAPTQQSGARFGIGVTALYYQEPESDRVTPFAREHMQAMARLGDALASFDVISTVGIVQDVAPEISDLYATLEMVTNAVKPLVILVSDDDRYPAVLDLLAHLHGDLAERPFVVPYFNPISPLVLNRGTADKMFLTIERGLPFIFSNYGMAGATTPITPAGTLTLLNAELLAGLVLSQLIRAGRADYPG